MPPIVSIALAITAVAGASATILISGSRAYDEIAVPQAASGLAMIYEEAAYEYNKADEPPLPESDHQAIARALEAFEDPNVNYLDAAERRLKRRSAYLSATREDPPEMMQLGKVISFDDPWGSPFQFVVAPNGDLTVTSLGPDKTLDTSDDVTSDLARKRQKLPRPSTPAREKYEADQLAKEKKK